MSNSIDSERVLNKLLRQYNSMYHRINFASREIIYHFFKTYSSSFYGIELWYTYNDIYRNIAFHNVSVGYHKAVKGIAGLCTWDRNHLTIWLQYSIWLCMYSLKWIVNPSDSYILSYMHLLWHCILSWNIGLI